MLPIIGEHSCTPNVRLSLKSHVQTEDNREKNKIESESDEPPTLVAERVTMRLKRYYQLQVEWDISSIPDDSDSYNETEEILPIASKSPNHFASEFWNQLQ